LFKNNEIENLVNVTYKEWKNGRNLRLFKKTKLAKELQSIVKKFNDFGNYFLTKERFCLMKRTFKNGQNGKKKLADKPGSVLTLRQATVIHLGASLLIRSSNLPADGASHAIVSLFGLAADGGCRVSP
jgi:hypothetical protein